MKDIMAIEKYSFAILLAISSIFYPCSSAEFLEAIKSTELVDFPGNVSHGPKCSDQPDISERLVATGQKLGVRVLIGKPLLEGKDATYEALSGELGTIVVSPRIMTPEVRCKLISHEFIHVLQHLRADLKGVEPLGWVVPLNALARFGSLQEAEAYTHQNKASLVLKLLLVELQERQIP